ncbi:MAG TPA: hypothetical protein VIK37_02840 [Candidatus Saccharimonadales bacterium]
MVKRIRFPEGSPESVLDVFESIKRAFIHRGLIRQKRTLKKSALPPVKRSKRLLAVAELGHDVLFKANTVFPFTLFPDSIILDREKVTFVTRYFFRVAKITGIPVRDLLSVEADIGPFFGSVHTASRFFLTTPFSIKWLRRKDAVELRRLLQGYIICNEQDIDCTKIERHKLIAMLNDLGGGETR